MDALAFIFKRVESESIGVNQTRKRTTHEVENALLHGLHPRAVQKQT